MRSTSLATFIFFGVINFPRLRLRSYVDKLHDRKLVYSFDFESTTLPSSLTDK